MTVGREASVGRFRPEMWSQPQRVRSDPEEIQSSPFGSFSEAEEEGNSREPKGSCLVQTKRENSLFLWTL